MTTVVTHPVDNPDSFEISRVYKPWPHQTDFHTSSAKYRLQVGSYGSGKSRPLLWEGIFHALEYPGSESIILRKTIPDLKRTVIEKFISGVPSEIYDYYHETDKIVYFHPVKARRLEAETGAWVRLAADELACSHLMNGKDCLQREVSLESQCPHCQKHQMVTSKLTFGACETEKDVGKYLSTEYVYVGFEELGEFPFAIWDAFDGRNRCPIPGSRPCMAGATNPMGIGWGGFIKKLWVDHVPAHGMDPEKYDAAQYAFFHSTVDQNPIYSKNKEYIQSLERSPLRDKIRWGKLDTVSGQYFENWEPARHIRPASDFIFQSWQPVWIGWDWGFGHWACITFWTKAVLRPRWEGAKPKTVNVCIGEVTLERQTSEEQVKALISYFPSLLGSLLNAPSEKEEDRRALAGHVVSVHFSWERFVKSEKDKQGNEVSVADQVGQILSDAGFPFPVRSSTDRIGGWTKMYSLLDADDIFFLKAEGMHRGCPILAESIPLLVRGDGVKVSLEDVVKPPGRSLEDDIGDSCFAAGTLIDTARGLVPIELVTIDDYVLTRQGFKRVLASGQTGTKSVIQIDRLLVTPNHPVFCNGKFVLSYDTQWQKNPTFLTSKSYSKASRIDAIRTASTPILESISQEGRTGAIRSFTSKSIAALMARFRKAVTFTTETRIRLTINSKTLLRSLLNAICASICLRQRSAFVAVDRFNQAGTVPILMPDIAQQSARCSLSRAVNAGENSNRSMDAGKSNGSARTPVSRHGAGRKNLTMYQRVVNVAVRCFPIIASKLFGFALSPVQIQDRQEVLSARPVFNLSVEDAEEYFANGILVHNCRYAVAGALLDEGDKPPEVKLREKLAGIKDPMARQVAAFKSYNEEQARNRAPKKPVFVPTWRSRLPPAGR